MATKEWETHEEQKAREALPPHKLMGYCDHCKEWYKFDDDPDNPESRNCTICGGKYSTRIGFQLTTQRSFNPYAKKMTKAQLKKMGGLG